MNSRDNRIYIDCSNLVSNYGGYGLKRYNKNLLKAILKINSESEIIYDNISFKHIPQSLNKFLIPYRDNFILPKILKQKNVNIVHFLRGSGTFKDLKGVKRVHTFHHIENEHIGKTPLARKIYKKIITKRVIELSDHIICISESTKNDLINEYEVCSKKISVIYHGIDPKFLDKKFLNKIKKDRKLARPPEKFILSVGTICSRKNYIRLIRAFNIIAAQNKKIELVIVGGNGWNYAAVYKEVSKSHFFNRIHLTGFVNDKQLIKYYLDSQVFVIPSLYEGFCIPLIEAMACGCPIACSGASSLPEIAGDAAIYFNPLNVKDIANKINKLLLSKDLMKKKAKKACARSVKYNWEEAAKKTLDVYNTVLNNDS